MNEQDETELDQFESLNHAFREMLVPCLEECARGRHGLFGHRASSGMGADLAWPEAERARELALSIQSVLAQAGECNALCDEFLDLCSIHGENDPGEPRLARSFLKRIESGEVGTATQEERRPW